MRSNAVAADARPSAGHGLLLVRRPPAAVGRWLRRGLVAATVVPYGRWTAVTVAEDAARSAAPFDVALEVLAARPVPRSACPAIGMFALGGHAVVTLQPGGVRRAQHWLVWQPRTGVVETPSLPRLALGELVGAAGGGARVQDVAGVLRAGDGEPLDVLVTVLRLLGLPGEELLVRGHPAGAADVEPGARGVLAFDRLVADEAQHRAEWEAARGEPSVGREREVR